MWDNPVVGGCFRCAPFINYSMFSYSVAHLAYNRGSDRSDDEPFVSFRDGCEVKNLRAGGSEYSVACGFLAGLRIAFHR